jgi:hypothetical protein
MASSQGSRRSGVPSVASHTPEVEAVQDFIDTVTLALEKEAI